MGESSASAEAGALGKDATPLRTRPRRVLRTLLRLSLALLVGLLALEGVLRFVLFADLARDTRFATRLRHEGFYADNRGAEYWKLTALFARGGAVARPHRFVDTRTGWLKEELDPLTLAHADEARLAGRRPVLLFGDSYAQCVTRVQSCWQDLLERSDLAARYGLLNYGVGGYGLDQALLLFRLAIDRFQARDPIVVVGILVDDDLDRCFLGLRNHTKPWFTLAGEELVLHPPAAADALGFVRGHPVEIHSYLWRAFLFGSGLVDPSTARRWSGEGDPVTTKQALIERLLAEFRREFEARHLTYFFLLFHGQGAASVPGPSGWQEPLLYRTFERMNAPFVSSKRWLRAHARQAGRASEELYFTSGGGLGHYNDLGNSVVFEALRQGLLGRFEPYEYLAE